LFHLLRPTMVVKGLHRTNADNFQPLVPSTQKAGLVALA
jgi:hypothetical protein